MTNAKSFFFDFFCTFAYDYHISSKKESMSKILCYYYLSIQQLVVRGLNRQSTGLAETSLLALITRFDLGISFIITGLLSYYNTLNISKLLLFIIIAAICYIPSSIYSDNIIDKKLSTTEPIYKALGKERKTMWVIISLAIWAISWIFIIGSFFVLIGSGIFNS